MTSAEAAARLQVSRWTLHAWRKRKNNPLPFVRVGRAARYRPQDVAKFISDHLVGAT